MDLNAKGNEIDSLREANSQLEVGLGNSVKDGEAATRRATKMNQEIKMREEEIDQLMSLTRNLRNEIMKLKNEKKKISETPSPLTNPELKKDSGIINKSKTLRSPQH